MAGGPSEHCGRCRDTERVCRRCEGLRCGGEGAFSSQPGGLQHLHHRGSGFLDGCMDGWRTLSPTSLQVLLLILILKSPKHKVLSLSSLIEQVYRHGCNHAVCIYPPPRLLAQRWGRHDGQAPLSSLRTLACGQSPSPRVAVSLIHSSRRPPCCLPANAAMATARHVTNREVTGLTVEGREGQSLQMREPSCSSSRLPPGLTEASKDPSGSSRLLAV